MSALDGADDSCDAEALHRCQAGDITGLDVLVARYQLGAVRLAYLLVQDRAAAEDIAQESFLHVFRAAAGFRRGAPFEPWFHRIVLNTARQHVRQRQRQRESSLDALRASAEAPFDLPAPTPGPPDQLVGAERRAAVLDALRALTHKQREALVLRYYCGHTDAEIARLLGVPPGTTRWRLHAALRAFERALRRMHPWLLEGDETPARALGRVEGSIQE